MTTATLQRHVYLYRVASKYAVAATTTTIAIMQLHACLAQQAAIQQVARGNFQARVCALSVPQAAMQVKDLSLEIATYAPVVVWTMTRTAGLGANLARLEPSPRIVTVTLPQKMPLSVEFVRAGI